MDWFRWWHGTVTDPKFQWVARRSGQPLPTVIAVWACLLECASNATQCNADATRGNVASFDCNDYDVLLGLDDGSVQRIYSVMEEKSLIVDGRITGWEGRQPKREDSGNPNTGVLSNTERSRLHREKKKLSETVGNAVQRDATQCNAREDKSREELKEPPIPPKGGEPDPLTKRSAVAFKTFLENCRTTGEKPIPENDTVFTYADETGLPVDFLRLHWLEFKERYTAPDAKRYKDWRAVYRKSVRSNWFRLWFLRNDGQCGLTTQGEQARRHHKEAA